MESNDNLYKECDEIISRIPSSLTNDEKIRYLYVEVGKKLSKNPEFFYESDPEKQKEIYDNYQVIENREVICRSVVHLYCNLASKLGLECRPIKMDETDHWALVYENDNKKYLINPMQDFYRVQLGFSTRNFCHAEDYHGYSTETFDSMSDEYLRQLDESIGYLNSGCYTEELFEKLSTEMRNKLGIHIVRTSDYYQDYYFKMLELIQNKDITISEKLEIISEIDPELDKHKNTVEEAFEKEIIDNSMKKVIHNLAFRKLINSDLDLKKEKEGSDFVGSMDVSNLKNMKKQIMLYKFNYMINCIPKYTTSLTGYIENKNFIEELSKFMFQTPQERECVRRHTVVHNDDNGKKDYYLMFSIKDPDDDDSFYCFYNHKTKEFKMPIEPLSFMLDNNMVPLKDSTLHERFSSSSSISLSCSEFSNSSGNNVSKK